MNVKCINNLKKDFPKRGFKFDITLENTVSLIIEKKYTVYGVSDYDNLIWYSICNEDYETLNYPIWYPYYFFEIIDQSVSRYWFFSLQENYKKNSFFLGIKEWSNEPYFNDKLTDGEIRELEIFRSYKELMDLEFSDESISITAHIGDCEWLMCPLCNDAWYSKSVLNGMVRGANCKKIMRNPRYN